MLKKRRCNTSVSVFLFFRARNPGGQVLNLLKIPHREGLNSVGYALRKASFGDALNPRLFVVSIPHKPFLLNNSQVINFEVGEICMYRSISQRVAIAASAFPLLPYHLSFR